MPSNVIASVSQPLLGSLPSPSTNELVLGPFTLRLYGLAIACGVLAAVWLSRRRWEARGGDPEDVTSIALWAVPAGLVGARLYHVITDWRTYFPDRPVEALYVWQGGLGIPGGIALGTVVGIVVARRYGIRISTGIDVVAPALPVAQAIGRLGNWFNQELFGRPTDLPWGLEIEPANRPAGYAAYETFHPTFLYEMLWNLALVGVLIAVDRRRTLRPGNVFALYVGGYFLGRLWIESMRIDTASEVLGMRVNIWTSLVGIAVVAVVLVVRGLRRREGEADSLYLDGHVFEDVGESGDLVVAAGDAGPGGSGSDPAGAPGAQREGAPGGPGGGAEGSSGSPPDDGEDPPTT